ncbi:MAG TPA: NUDIX domain-containing protein [Xanthobacteraceae bacterium]|nr:NUDIX domain-containing protein [Xanthobacteraceae bacterium]
MPGSRKVRIGKQTRLLDDFFKVDEVYVAHQQLDGTMSEEQRRLVFERGDAVAALLYNPDTNDVIIVNQFKYPSLVGRQRDNAATTDGWITETVAGMIDGEETPEEAVIRETREETGYRIKKPELICKFFSSPGGTSERIFLFFVEVTEADRVSAGGGVPGEDVGLVRKPAHELIGQLEARQIEDPKLAIAAAWLRGHIQRMGPLAPTTVAFALKDKPDRVVGYKTGTIEDVRDVDIWVNSENTDMMMDRFIGKTISARIRYHGANKEGDTVLDDTIQESLRNALGERAHVKIGTVLVTEAGMLRTAPHNVERIFHVATVEGGPGAGVKAELEKLRLCVERVLQRVDQENRSLRRILFKDFLTSIVFPMIGAGDGGLSVEKVADDIVPVAIHFLRNNPDSKLREIYFLAFKARDRGACHRTLESFCGEGGVLTRPGEAR